MHRHRWEEVQRTFTPGNRAKDIEITYGGSEFAEWLIFGFTTVEQKCAVCGRLRFEKTTGSAHIDGSGCVK